MKLILPTTFLLLVSTSIAEYYCPDGLVEQVIDFDTDVEGNPIDAGGPLTADMPYGMQVTTTSTQDGVAYNNVPAWLYDSNSVGGADPDLESSVGNVAMIQVQSDPEPNDFGGGGVLKIMFDVPLYIQSIDLVDTNTVTPIRLFYEGTEVSKTKLPPQEENAVTTVLLGEEADFIRIRLRQSGAVSEIAVCVVPCGGGVLVINEIMINPDAVTDGNGEWIELYNPGDTDVDLIGWKFKDTGSDMITIDESVIVPSNGYAVLARNGDFSANGGVNAVYDYPGLVFANTADEVFLFNPCDEIVDSVVWGNGFGQPGASYSLADPNVPNDNLDNGNWCLAPEGGPTYGDGDRGTPGAPNDCGD